MGSFQFDNRQKKKIQHGKIMKLKHTKGGQNRTQQQKKKEK